MGEIKTAVNNVRRIFAYERRMSVAKTEAGLLPSSFVKFCEKWLTMITSPTVSIHSIVEAGLNTKIKI